MVRKIWRCRFRLRTLLLLPVLFAAGWWWITWPARTADRFVTFLMVRDLDSARAMIDGEQPTNAVTPFQKSARPIILPPQLLPGTWSEFLSGSRRFNLVWGGSREFVASRGRIVLPPRFV